MKSKPYKNSDHQEKLTRYYNDLNKVFNESMIKRSSWYKFRLTNGYTTGSEIKARVAKHEESERKIMGDILKPYSSVLNGKGYNGLRFKDAQRLMNMRCSEMADKASINTNPI